MRGDDTLCCANIHTLLLRCFQLVSRKRSFNWDGAR